MKPIKTDQTNRVYTAPGCYDLPAFNDSARTTAIYELDDADMEQLQKTRRLYFSIYSGKTIPPISVSVDNPIKTHLDANKLIAYDHIILKAHAEPMILWNQTDGPAPMTIHTDKGVYKRQIHVPMVACHYKELKKNDYILMHHPEDNRRIIVRIDNVIMNEETQQPNYSETIFELITP